MTTTQPTTTRTRTADQGRTVWTEVLTARYEARLIPAGYEDGEWFAAQWGVVEVATGGLVDAGLTRRQAERVAAEMNWVESL